MIKQVKRNNLESSDWSPTTQSEVARTGCCSLKQSLVRLRDQFPVAFWARSLGARLQLDQANFVQNLHSRSLRASLTARLELVDGSLKRTLISSEEKKLRISKPFFPNTPILIFPRPKHVPNNVYMSYT